MRRLILLLLPVALAGGACSSSSSSSSASELPAVGAGGKCPVTTFSSEPVKTVSPLLGDGLIRPATGSTIMIESDSSYPGWSSAKVIWYTPPGAGSVMLRGQRIDGTGEVAFVEGSDPMKSSLELQRLPSMWGDVPTALLVKTPGCYAFRIDDGKSTSYVVVSLVAKTTAKG
jgi:hypothetical protein